MTVTAFPVPILKDNYAWLLRESSTGATAIVDPADAQPIIEALEKAGGRLDLILLTHHHADHIAGVDEVRARFNCPVVGAAADQHRLPKLDEAVREGDTVRLGNATAQVIETPGHTRGQINFFFPDGDILLSGDTLFSLGCGRLIEGTPAEMYASLRKLAALPPDTLVCCGHEYTESNARFALAVDPDNAALHEFAGKVEQLRAAGQPSVPSVLGDELKANPFLLAPDVNSFAAVRAKKDNSSGPSLTRASKRPANRPTLSMAGGQNPTAYRLDFTHCGRCADVKLYYSPTSPYVRKVMACAIIRGLDGRIEKHTSNPHASPADLVADNPLSKVPCLITDDGLSLFGSQLICEYLDSLGEGLPLFPDHGAPRWRALKFQSLGDGILDAAVPCRGEQGKPPEAARSAQIDRYKAVISRAVDTLEADPPHKHVDIGSVTVACALGYLDFRFGSDPWREGHPKLAAWYEAFDQNKGLAETAPA